MTSCGSDSSLLGTGPSFLGRDGSFGCPVEVRTREDVEAGEPPLPYLTVPLSFGRKTKDPY